MVAINNASTRVKRKGHPEDQAVADLSYQSDAGLLKQFWRFRAYGRHELRPLLFGVLMRFGELISDMLTPWPLAFVIGNVLKGTQPHGVLGDVLRIFGPSQIDMLLVAALAVLLIVSSSGAFDYLGDRLMNSAGERITSNIRGDVFAHMQRLPMGYHDRNSVGELTSRIATDTGRIEDGMVGLFATLIPGIMSLAGYTIALLSINWRLGLVALCAAPLLFFTAGRYTKLTRKSSRRRRAAEGKLSGFVAESLQGIRTVQAFGRQDLHDKRFKDGNDKVLSAGLRAVDLRARFTPILEVIAAIGTATLLFVGGYGVIYSWWSVPVLVVVTSYLKDMLKPMRNLSGLALTFTQGAASAERIAAIFDEKAPRSEADDSLPEVIEGSIELDDVGLDYGRGPVLHGLDLTIHPGERIALLGHNGAGKSTLLSLISGLYPPTSGSVMLDGVSLADAPDWWRRRQVAVVLQDTFLFSGSIADNIRYGRPEATDEEVEAAAKAALVTEFTDKLDTGIHTELADGGIGLSGGQRQRVGIARALLTDAPVVLLDEPTTGLDVNAEELVVQALTPLVTKRTVVMTTHRPALTRLATRVVHLSRGTVTDTPDEAALAAEPQIEIATPATNGQTGSAPANGAPVNGRANGSSVDAYANGAPVNGRTNGSPVYAHANGSSVNGRSNGVPVDGYAGGTRVNGHVNGAPVNGRTNGAPVNGQANGAPLNGYPNGAPPPRRPQPPNGQGQRGPAPRYQDPWVGGGSSPRPPAPGYRPVGPQRPIDRPSWPEGDLGRHPNEQHRRPVPPGGRPIDPANWRPGEQNGMRPGPSLRRPPSAPAQSVRPLGPMPRPPMRPADPASRRRIGRFSTEDPFAGSSTSADGPDAGPPAESWYKDSGYNRATNDNPGNDSPGHDNTERGGAVNGTEHNTGSEDSTASDGQSDGRRREMGNESCA